MQVTRDKIVYHNGTHSEVCYKRADRFDKESEWLVFVPWDLDVESVEGIHMITVNKKNGSQGAAFLKEKVYSDEHGSNWTMYDMYNGELEVVKPEIEES